MLQLLKKINRYSSYLILVIGLSIPLLLFLNRFLIPDVSFDSTNYHYYLGYKGFHPENNIYEFFPTGIHNFAPFFDMFGYGLSTIVGYRLGTTTSLIFIYLSVFVAYRLVKLIDKKIEIIGNFLNSYIFVSSFLSFELFLEIATYYVDAISMFFLLLSTFFLLKMLIDNREKYLYLSTLILSLAILGKQTNLYYVFPYGVGVLYFLIKNKNSVLNVIKKLILVGLTLISAPLPWYIKNYHLTNNPVFPFYNGIFKSIYFPEYNFNQIIFGGRSLIEKCLWGIYSIFDPVRLGEVHDLFTDYKINFYFIGILFLFILYLIFNKIKNYKLIIFSLFYLALFEFWAMQFGYLRYGLILEILGGILILLLFNGLRNKWLKYAIIIPFFIFLVVQNKKIINMSLAYDISFRPGYYYNRNTYIERKISLFDNMINTLGNEQINPVVYVNCSVQGMTFYPLSIFSELPVMNISDRAYYQMTNNDEYKKERNVRIKNYLIDNKFDSDKIPFVSITTYKGLGNEYDNCVKSINNAGFDIVNEEMVDFIGNKDVVLKVIYGNIVN